MGNWTFGSPKDPEKKITPYLVGWADLSDEVREWDRQAVRNIPFLLAHAKFEIYRMTDGG